MQTIPEKQLPHYLVGGLNYSAVHWQEIPHAIEHGLQWYRPIAGQGHYHLPLFLVQDIGWLLRFGFETPFASEQGYADWKEEERAVRLRYENEILGRLLQEPLVQSCLETLQYDDPTQERTQRLLELLLRSFAPIFPREWLVNPAHIRALQPTLLQQSNPQKHLEAFHVWSQQENLFLEQLRQFLDQAAACIRWSELLQPEDLFELAHWDVLDTEEIRIGCRQILEVERKLGELDIRNVAIADEGADVETAFVDETHYPTGGLSELTNRGSFENLVLSELAYMEHGEEIDLFDVRFVEGELLYYLRDSGQLQRKRRTVHLLLDLEECFQLKSSGYSYQFSILVQGILLRMTRDLLKLFENDSLIFHFHYIHRQLEPTPFEREMKLMQLLLADEVQHGWVTLQLTSELDLETLRVQQRKTYSLVFCHKHNHTWQRAFDEARREHPPIFGISIPIDARNVEDDTLHLPINGLSFDKLLALKDRIIVELVGLRSNETHNRPIVPPKPL